MYSGLPKCKNTHLRMISREENPKLYTIASPETAYLCGVCLSRGRLTTSTFEVRSIDYELVLETRQVLEFLTDCPGQIAREANTWYICCADPLVVDFLWKITCRGSQVPRDLFKAPLYLVRYFLAGYFDGKGFVQETCSEKGVRYLAGFSGPPTLLDDLAKLFQKAGVHLRKRTREGTTYFYFKLPSLVKTNLPIRSQRKYQRLRRFVLRNLPSETIRWTPREGDDIVRPAWRQAEVA